MVTTYAAQPIQELIQVMVPQTQTVNTIQTINKVTKYAHTPVNAYSYAGPTTSMPMTTGMPMTTRARVHAPTAHACAALCVRWPWWHTIQSDTCNIERPTCRCAANRPWECLSCHSSRVSTCPQDLTDFKRVSIGTLE